jgi:hypothetical protein
MGLGNARGRDGGALNDVGASVVEFAFLMPLLILLLCGIIEVGWLFTQNLDVRHGAAEAARLAAVDGDIDDVCDRLDVAAPGATVVFERDGDDVGDEVRATVTSPARTMTGLLDWAFPSSMQLQHTAKVRLEQQDPAWPTPTNVSC